MKLSNTSRNNWDTIAYRDTSNIQREIEVVVVDTAKGDQEVIGRVDFNSSRVVFEQYETIVDKGCSDNDIKQFVPKRQVTVGGFDTYDADEFESGVKRCFELMIKEAYGQFWRQEMDVDDIQREIDNFTQSVQMMVEGELGEDARTLREGDQL